MHLFSQRVQHLLEQAWVLGRSVFRSCFQIILAGVLSLSWGSTDITGIFFFGIHYGFGPPPSQSLFTIWHSFLAKEKKLKLPYLAYFSLKWKNKTTLFSPTLKVRENKVVLFFQFELKWARYRQFPIWNFCSWAFRA